MLKLHHIGMVVKNIEDYLKTSEFTRSTKVVYDPAQHSNICMLENADNATPIELIEPIDERSTTYQYLNKCGNGIHHLCYQVNSYEDLKVFMAQHKLKRIFGPVKATVFDQQKVVFAYSKTRGIVEFVILNRRG